jgi:hypothetical protein
LACRACACSGCPGSAPGASVVPQSAALSVAVLLLNFSQRQLWCWSAWTPFQQSEQTLCPLRRGIRPRAVAVTLAIQGGWKLLLLYVTGFYDCKLASQTDRSTWTVDCCGHPGPRAGTFRVRYPRCPNGLRPRNRIVPVPWREVSRRIANSDHVNRWSTSGEEVRCLAQLCPCLTPVLCL